MTPIDPAFFLIPILQAIKPVGKPPYSSLVHAYCSPQNDGSAGLFQPLDDILDEALPKINGRTSDDAFPPISQEDMLFLTRCDCVVNALKRICDFQSAPVRNPLSSGDLSSRDRYADITSELTVYRYSEDKVIEYLQAKVSRLSKHAVAEKSRTIIRNLAKDGLMDDGKEDLLKRRCPVGQQGVGIPKADALPPSRSWTPQDGV